MPKFEASTSSVVQQYLDELAGDSPADPIVRALLDRSARRLYLLCSTWLFQSYPRLTRHPVNLAADEMLSALVERLLKALALGTSPNRSPVLQPWPISTFAGS